MTISGTRFGEIEFAPTDVLFLKEGLIGFPKMQEFILLSHKEASPFRWMQSVQEPTMAFLCALPQHFVPEYNPELPVSVVEGLSLEDATERYVLTTATIPSGCPDDMTLNLAAPILVNANTRSALQFVLDDEAYTVKHRVFPEAKVKQKVAA
jgi:flagellar assembly factor FliW